MASPETPKRKGTREVHLAILVYYHYAHKLVYWTTVLPCHTSVEIIFFESLRNGKSKDASCSKDLSKAACLLMRQPGVSRSWTMYVHFTSGYARNPGCYSDCTQ